MRTTHQKATIAGGVMSLAAAAAVLVPSQSAFADATGCSQNVCMYLAGNAGGTVVVQAWARSSEFTGYFTLSGPGSVNQTSSNQSWEGSKGNYWSTSVSGAAGGTYCITGNPSQGTACESLS